MSTLFKPDNQVWTDTKVVYELEMAGHQVYSLFDTMSAEEKAEIIVQLLSDDEDLERLVKDWVSQADPLSAPVADNQVVIERAEEDLAPEIEVHSDWDGDRGWRFAPDLVD